jgi:hypothetical protein
VISDDFFFFLSFFDLRLFLSSSLPTTLLDLLRLLRDLLSSPPPERESLELLRGLFFPELLLSDFLSDYLSERFLYDNYPLHLCDI